MDRDNNNHPAFRTLRNVDLNLLTIFEAVYVHKGIVNAAKVLNLTPSAISQSIQKLRLIFPDPLFIRKGQGVAPTAYAANLHEHVSHGLETILSALDFNSTGDKPRIITIATHSSISSLLIPRLYSAIQKINANLLIHNILVTDAEMQLTQFQTDILIDGNYYSSRAIGTRILFTDKLVTVCRKDHPCVDELQTLEALQSKKLGYIHIQDDLLRDTSQKIKNIFPDQQPTFSSYNFTAAASVLSNSDLIGFLPQSLVGMFKEAFQLQEIENHLFNDSDLEIKMHFNKLSGRDMVLQEVIDAICTEFQHNS